MNEDDGYDDNTGQVRWTSMEVTGVKLVLAIEFALSQFSPNVPN